MRIDSWRRHFSSSPSQPISLSPPPTPSDAFPSRNKNQGIRGFMPPPIVNRHYRYLNRSHTLENGFPQEEKLKI